MPALFTRETLSKIRAQAPLRQAPQIADELGWTLDRLRRTAHAHGIELVNPNPTITPPKPSPPDPVITPEGEITGSTSLDEIIALLPLRQAQVLRILKSESECGRFVSASEIAGRTMATTDGTNDVMQKLRRKLQASRWRIDAVARRGGGYRLVERAQP